MRGYERKMLAMQPLFPFFCLNACFSQSNYCCVGLMSTPSPSARAKQLPELQYTASIESEHFNHEELHGAITWARNMMWVTANVNSVQLNHLTFDLLEREGRPQNLDDNVAQERVQAILPYTTPVPCCILLSKCKPEDETYMVLRCQRTAMPLMETGSQ